ncbi:2-C-methyl-D-erythritol 4-phosphate cytidylyltransferase [Cellulomonas fimi]|uniref:2-C-methyl-D-erythritol 4-phosphate cytidylyltransferase n=1 Tax=Cellulomonas fimi (strain ATCC 484 / DSM 20113 / JCM 1341 / CCUG 24087 / LMG 16345 / NBRC 15513 / NCIMB 8980 / NCTC 7547 / NRS-133) TaxID=590998 RepID=F4GY69_CELFA|nr:2-C-methyl-D-erythritol 4-phosphate cytidylyltransferase [Cellulomonas fimi]AEE44737.1 2-C-methyl-D-erythritol 4-phosphate cytidylyltransferase [Cellulomonas fimi ATCC 484]NNH06121.1 2-C-methyl-D-erythritol 4-phosphate cytidylyltransferase [Cellulomonas fimi]VEH27153.1 2-C-methyl-D-erythritol 4-phosphate cytidylyltransferase [Cellulomonas fimi]
MSVAAVLTAAGSGARLGHRLPKALVPLGGEPLLLHAARRLLEARTTTDDDRVTTLVVTAPADHVDAVRALLGHLGGDVVVVRGGATRQASVAAALEVLAAREGVDVVLVHDAARPLVPPALVARVVEAVRAGHVAVVPGLPVTDTVKQVGAAGLGDGPVVQPVLRTVPRADLRAVQTPQGFDLATLLRAHAHGAGVAHDEALAASDDAGLVELLGEPVGVVEGHEDAAKITTARDLAVAELLLRDARTAPLEAL